MTTATLTTAQAIDIRELPILNESEGLVWIGDKVYFVADHGWKQVWQHGVSGERRTVLVRAGKAIACDCQDARYRKRTCKHMVGAQSLLAAW